MDLYKIDDFTYVVAGDSTADDALELVLELCGNVPLIVADPPYGNIVDEAWDARALGQGHADWMLGWTKKWAQRAVAGGAMYVWGGIGRPGDRPFFRYLSALEEITPWQMAMLLTWKKRRAYGVRNNYLFTREECAYLVNGDAKRPARFDVPYLDEIRGYAGYDPEHPALDERYRRGAVWTDVTEIMRNKLHRCHKPSRLFEIMIETHTVPGDWVVDLFGGSGECAVTARRMGRKSLTFELDGPTCDAIIARLSDCAPILSN